MDDAPNHTQKDEPTEQAKLEALRAAILEGEEGGIAPDGVFDRVLAELDAKPMIRILNEPCSLPARLLSGGGAPFGSWRNKALDTTATASITPVWQLKLPKT
jgi:hypothetical protein